MTTNEPTTVEWALLFLIVAIAAVVLAGCDSYAKATAAPQITLTVVPPGRPAPPTPAPAPAIPQPPTPETQIPTPDSPTVTPPVDPPSPIDTPDTSQPDQCKQGNGRGEGNGTPGNGKGRGDENGKACR